MADNKMLWFVQILRDACDEALNDGMVGNQCDHIEKIEVTYSGSPIELRATCFGAYSPTKSQEVHENLGVIQAADMVARYLAYRAVELSELKGLCNDDNDPQVS